MSLLWIFVTLMNLASLLWLYLMRRERQEVHKSQVYLLGVHNKHWVFRSGGQRLWKAYVFMTVFLVFLSYGLTFLFYVALSN